MEDRELISRAKLASKSVKIVWIGEFENFKDPFYVAELISNYFDFVGFGILSPLKRSCKKILKLIENLGTNIIVGLAPGKYDNAKRAIEITLDCIKYLKKHLNSPVFAGCSSPIITSRTSEVVDGILFNYVKREFIDWISKFAKKELFFAAYGPSLILPSMFLEDLLIASAIVISSKAFIKEFGFEELFNEVKQIDFQKLIKTRQMGKSVKGFPEYKILNKHSKILLENFTISGDAKKVVERINSLLKSCDHVVLSDPFFRDLKSLKSLSKIAKLVDK